MDSSSPRDSLSDVLAEAVSAASASIVRVQARPGPAASGIALASDLVVTAEHALDPTIDDVRVGLPGGEMVEARLVGRDQATDLAVLRVPDAHLSPAIGATSEPRAGSIALIVARPNRGVLTSFGVVSGTAGPVRTAERGVLEKVIYVDAVMYPGFSGGALIGTNGGVLGMVSSGLSIGGPSAAIPWGDAARFGRLLVEHGRIQRGYLGVKTQPIELSPLARAEAGQSRGLLVVDVEEGGPAGKAGLLQGDIAVRINSEPIHAIEEMQGDVFTRRVDYPPFPFPTPGGMPGQEDLLFNAPVPPPDVGMGRGKRVVFLRHPAPHTVPTPPPDLHLFWRADEDRYADDLQALLGPESVGSNITVSILRGGSLLDLQLEVAARSGD